MDPGFLFLLKIISSSKGCSPQGIRIPVIFSYIRVLKADIGNACCLPFPDNHIYLVLVLIKDPLTIKRMLSLRHLYTRDFFICQSLQADIGKRMLSSPPASLLPRYGRNRIRAGRRTKTQLKRVIQANVCLARLPCQNQFIADSQQWSHIENPNLLNVIDPDWDYWFH